MMTILKSEKGKCEIEKEIAKKSTQLISICIKIFSIEQRDFKSACSRIKMRFLFVCRSPFQIDLYLKVFIVQEGTCNTHSK